jgi:hypothetical protein
MTDFYQHNRLGNGDDIIYNIEKSNREVRYNVSY